MLERDHESLSLRQQCALMGINRSTFYYEAVVSPQDTVLTNEIHEIWTEMPFYGYRRITAEFRRRGYGVNTKRILRLMREANIQALYPRPKTTIGSAQSQIYPYLLRDLEITRPNHVWTTDITYLKMPVGFAYLVALIDVYSRYILSWRLSNTMDTHFCLEMLDEALLGKRPDILNTDQGSQFTSHDWIARVKGAGICVSMDGKGRWADNIIIERFWRTLKHEHFLLHSFETLRHARQSLDDFIKLYNFRRLHQSLKYQTPAEVYGYSVLNTRPDGYRDNLVSGCPPYPQPQPQQTFWLTNGGKSHLI